MAYYASNEPYHRVDNQNRGLGYLGGALAGTATAGAGLYASSQTGGAHIERAGSALKNFGEEGGIRHGIGDSIEEFGRNTKNSESNIHKRKGRMGAVLGAGALAGTALTYMGRNG